ncbi:MAG: DUF362 domain-containing protein [Bacteroidota bacterium]|nr:DUF362 domain-containing protein [Bacteroidota bacterium]
MDRREFFKRSIYSGLAAGAAFSFGSLDKIIAAMPYRPYAPFDLVAVKGGEPAQMFDKAIEALGGMKNFVKKNQTVVVKPNIGWDTPPERGADTNPALVKRIIEHCFTAGAKEVYVFDNPCDNWIKCYKNSGIEKAVKDAGGKIVPANSESNYQEVEIKNGKKLKKTKVHELILSSNVFINVPVLKCHTGAQLTMCMKNHMGTVWDRGYWHRNDLQQCIADFAGFRKPDLNIVDAYRVMTKRGPRGVSIEDTVLMKSMILSRDIVAADAASAKLYGIEPETIGHIKYAAEAHIGNMDLTKLNIKRIKI